MAEAKFNDTPRTERIKGQKRQKNNNRKRDVVALTEAQVEFLRRFGRPEAHRVDHVVLVARNGAVVGHGKHHLIRRNDSVNSTAGRAAKNTTPKAKTTNYKPRDRVAETNQQRSFDIDIYTGKSNNEK